MSDELTYTKYWTEIKSIAKCLVEESMADNDNDKEQAEEDINDSRLHETIDGHQWIIYTAYNLDVIKHSNNQGYMSDYFGDEALEEALKTGLNSLHCAIAFWCMYADVYDNMDSAWDNFEKE